MSTSFNFPFNERKKGGLAKKCSFLRKENMFILKLDVDIYQSLIVLRSKLVKHCIFFVKSIMNFLVPMVLHPLSLVWICGRRGGFKSYHNPQCIHLDKEIIF